MLGRGWSASAITRQSVTSIISRISATTPVQHRAELPVPRCTRELPWPGVESHRRDRGFPGHRPRVSPLSTPYRTLPRVNLDATWYTNSGLEYGIDSEYTVFDRNLNRARFTPAQIASGELVTGSRLALTPQISLPWSSAGAFVTPRSNTNTRPGTSPTRHSTPMRTPTAASSPAASTAA